MFELRSLFRKRPKKKKVKVRRKVGGERENKPIEKRSGSMAGTVGHSGAPKKQSIVKKTKTKAPVKKVTPTEVATRMKDRGKGRK